MPCSIAGAARRGFGKGWNEPGSARRWDGRSNLAAQIRLFHPLAFRRGGVVCWLGNRRDRFRCGREELKVDGNERTGRLLLNWQLLRAGFPLTIIQVEERARYLDALDQGHAGNLLPLQTLVAESVERSLDLAAGEKA